LTRAGRFQDR